VISKKRWKINGYQLGVKYYNALDKGFVSAECGHVYSEPITNYGHNNQNIITVAILENLEACKIPPRKVLLMQKNSRCSRVDFDTVDNQFNYGGNIYKDYDLQRHRCNRGQGNKTTVLIADLQAGYVVNPATNFKFW
jgi:hypothetical protein